MKIFNERFALWIAGIGILLILVFLVIFFWGESLSLHSQINDSKFGELGSVIGGVVGSLWALAGVILFYVALSEQRKDVKTNLEALKTQIQEFELQREELIETRKVYQQQSETMAQQRFETTFFNLMKIYSEKIENLKYGQLQGQKLFSSPMNILNGLNKTKIVVSEFNHEKKTFNDISEIVNYWYNLYDMILLKNVFRYFENVLEFLVYSNDVNTWLYRNIFISMMSEDEIKVYFYLGLVNEKKEIKQLYEDLAFFTNMDEKDVLEKDHLNRYRHTAN
jgi:hypothetical protein